jgi:hypothetical protein
LASPRGLPTGQAHSNGNGVGHTGAIGDNLGTGGPKKCPQGLFCLAIGGIDHVVGTCRNGGLPAHGHSIDSNHGVATSSAQRPQGKLANNTKAQYRCTSAQGQASANGGSHAVACHAGHGCFFKRQAVWHAPDAATLVANGEQFVGGVVARVTDPVSGLKAAGKIGAHSYNAAGGGIPGPEREFPIRHQRIFQPLVRAGVNGELGTSTNCGAFRSQKNLVGSRIGKSDLADFDLERIDHGCLQGLNWHGESPTL